MFTSFFISTAIMLLTVGLWILFHLGRSSSDTPSDSCGCVTGPCGDTMKIALFFRQHRVVRTSQKTDGCAHSLTCILAAARLAVGKNPEDLFKINAQAIEKNAGGLPEDHKHCARLAVNTLHSAADDYMKQITRNKGNDSL